MHPRPKTIDLESVSGYSDHGDKTTQQKIVLKSITGTRSGPTKHIIFSLQQINSKLSVLSTK